MVEIELSYIHNFQDDHLTLAALTEEFSRQHNVKVLLREMTWQTAWAELFGFALRVNGPHVSQVGGTWVSSLARMNALRLFTTDEIASIGGAAAFMPPAWNSCTLFDDERIWAVPWTGWIYVVCYRKDLLETADIDASTAFGTIQALGKTVERLSTTDLEIPWLNPQLPVAYRDLLHIAASGIWAAGGDFINEAGNKVIFNQPAAIDGLKEWLYLYRAVRPAHKQLSEPQTISLFHEGRAAAVLTNIREADRLLDMEADTTGRGNLGIATLTDAPWTGGSDFVVWQHVQNNAAIEQSAVELVKFLVSKEVNLHCRYELGTMPARMDALEEVYPAGNPLHLPAMVAARHGRAYRNIPLWRRIEYQLADVLGAVVREANDNLSVDAGSILRAHLDPLARQLNQTLGH